VSAEALWQAVVLAGDRGPADPVAAHFGVPCKALVPLAGKALLARVIEALEASGRVGAIVIAGPRAEHLDGAPWLARAIAAGTVRWQAPADGPAASVARALAALPERPTLVTTADHGLLDARLVGNFLDAAAQVAADVAVGLAPHAEVTAAFPGTRRTRLRLAGGALCGCNLFAVLTPRGRRAVAFWQSAETLRKRPARIARLLGAGTLARYLAGRLDAKAAFAAVSRAAGARVAPVLVHAPHAAVDVDSVADHALAAAFLKRIGRA
jgi:molybdopterin-guanine dinucleotide biosynthesis protein A